MYFRNLFIFIFIFCLLFSSKKVSNTTITTLWKWFRWPFDLNKKISTKNNYYNKDVDHLSKVELTFDRSLNVLVWLSTLLSTAVFVGTGTVTTIRLIGRWFKSAKDTAIDSGTLNQVLVAEMQAKNLQLKNLIDQLNNNNGNNEFYQKPSPFYDSLMEQQFQANGTRFLWILDEFIHQHYYTLIVLVIFLYACLMILFFHMMKNSSSDHHHHWMIENTIQFGIDSGSGSNKNQILMKQKMKKNLQRHQQQQQQQPKHLLGRKGRMGRKVMPISTYATRQPKRDCNNKIA